MLTLILVCLVVVLFAVWFARRPDVGLVILIWLLPFEKIGSFALFPSLGHPLIRPAQVAGAALILATLWRYRRVEVPKITWPLLALVVTAAVPALQFNYFRIWGEWMWLVYYVLLLLCVAQNAIDCDRQKLQNAIIFSAAVVCLFGLYQFWGDVFGLPFTALRAEYTKAIFGFPRVQSVAQEPLYFANYLLLPLLLSITSMATASSRTQKLAYYVISVAFLLTASKGGLMGLAGGLVLLLALARKDLVTLPSLKRLGWFGGTSIALAVLMISFASFISRGSFVHGIKTYFTASTTGLKSSYTYQERGQNNRSAVDEFKKGHQLFGIGLGGQGSQASGFAPVGKDAFAQAVVNNELLELLREVGIVGLLLWLLFCAGLLWRGGRASLDASDLWVAALTAALLATLIQAQTFSGFFLTYRWVGMGLLLGAVFEKK